MSAEITGGLFVGVHTRGSADAGGDLMVGAAALTGMVEAIPLKVGYSARMYRKLPPKCECGAPLKAIELAEGRAVGDYGCGLRLEIATAVSKILKACPRKKAPAPPA